MFSSTEHQAGSSGRLMHLAGTALVFRIGNSVLQEAVFHLPGFHHTIFLAFLQVLWLLVLAALPFYREKLPEWYRAWKARRKKATSGFDRAASKKGGKGSKVKHRDSESESEMGIDFPFDGKDATSVFVPSAEPSAAIDPLAPGHGPMQGRGPPAPMTEEGHKKRYHRRLLSEGLEKRHTRHVHAPPRPSPAIRPAVINPALHPPSPPPEPDGLHHDRDIEVHERGIELSGAPPARTREEPLQMPIPARAKHAPGTGTVDPRPHRPASHNDEAHAGQVHAPGATPAIRPAVVNPALHLPSPKPVGIRSRHPPVAPPRIPMPAPPSQPKRAPGGMRAPHRRGLLSDGLDQRRGAEVHAPGATPAIRPAVVNTAVHLPSPVGLHKAPPAPAPARAVPISMNEQSLERPLLPPSPAPSSSKGAAMGAMSISAGRIPTPGPISPGANASFPSAPNLSGRRALSRPPAHDPHCSEGGDYQSLSLRAEGSAAMMANDTNCSSLRSGSFTPPPSALSTAAATPVIAAAGAALSTMKEVLSGGNTPRADRCARDSLSRDRDLSVSPQTAISISGGGGGPLGATPAATAGGHWLLTSPDRNTPFRVTESASWVRAVRSALAWIDGCLPPRNAPLALYFGLSFLTVISSVLSNEAAHRINYPTMIMLKSSKLLFVMVARAIAFGGFSLWLKSWRGSRQHDAISSGAVSDEAQHGFVQQVAESTASASKTANATLLSEPFMSKVASNRSSTQRMSRGGSATPPPFGAQDMSPSPFQFEAKETVSCGVDFGGQGGTGTGSVRPSRRGSDFSGRGHSAGHGVDKSKHTTKSEIIACATIVFGLILFMWATSVSGGRRKSPRGTYAPSPTLAALPLQEPDRIDFDTKGQHQEAAVQEAKTTSKMDIRHVPKPDKFDVRPHLRPHDDHEPPHSQRPLFRDENNLQHQEHHEEADRHTHQDDQAARDHDHPALHFANQRGMKQAAAEDHHTRHEEPNLEDAARERDRGATNVKHPDGGRGENVDTKANVVPDNDHEYVMYDVVVGLVAVTIALCCDAAMYIGQEKYLFGQHKAKSNEIIFYLHLFAVTTGFFGMLFAAPANQSLPTSIAFAIATPKMSLLVGAYSVCNYIGMAIMLHVVSEFGANTAVVVTSVRKMMSVLLSFVIYPKPFGAVHGLGVGVVMYGVWLHDKARKEAKEETKQATTKATALEVAGPQVV